MGTAPTGRERPVAHLRVLTLVADELLRVVFKRLHVARSESDVYDNASAIDPQDGRDQLVRDTVLLDGFPAFEEYPLVELVLLDVLLEDFLFLVPGVDGEDHQPVLFVLIGETTNVRSLRTAGASAIRKERQEDGFAALIAETDLGPVEGGQFKIRGGFVLHLRHELSLAHIGATGQT